MGERTKSVAVIGAGWAGCAAAITLAERGWNVTLLEAARTLGGRARKVAIHGHMLDNGQHILLGAYSACLNVMRKVGVDPSRALLRLPLQMCYPEADDGMQFIASGLPAPFHVLTALLQARGLSTADKLALARFSTTARWMGWRLHDDCSVTELLQRFDQTTRLCELMWNPLCVAALNTPPKRASAQVFLNVLRDSLGGKRAASDMLIPRVDLSTLFPEAATAYIQRNGGNVMLGATVDSLSQDTKKWTISYTTKTNKKSVTKDAVVIATDARHAATILPANLQDTAAKCAGFSYEPITTCYLQYATDLSLARPLFALREQPGAGHWGQFVFDRGHLDAGQAGLLAVVISASTQSNTLSHSDLARSVAAQLALAFPSLKLEAPLWHQVISEKRATFSCTPGLFRPPNKTAFDKLYLAGDYTESDYPSTLEAAVRSGVQAAEELARC